MNGRRDAIDEVLDAQTKGDRCGPPARRRPRRCCRSSSGQRGAAQPRPLVPNARTHRGDGGRSFRNRPSTPQLWTISPPEFREVPNCRRKAGVLRDAGAAGAEAALRLRPQTVAEAVGVPRRSRRGGVLALRLSDRGGGLWDLGHMPGGGRHPEHRAATAPMAASRGPRSSRASVELVDLPPADPVVVDVPTPLCGRVGSHRYGRRASSTGVTLLARGRRGSTRRAKAAARIADKAGNSTFRPHCPPCTQAPASRSKPRRPRPPTSSPTGLCTTSGTTATRFLNTARKSRRQTYDGRRPPPLGRSSPTGQPHRPAPDARQPTGARRSRTSCAHSARARP